MHLHIPNTDKREQNRVAFEFSVGAGRYRELSRYREPGSRYQVGAITPGATGNGGQRTPRDGWMRTPPPTGGGGSCNNGPAQNNWPSSDCDAGTGRRVQYDYGYACEVKPPKCSCQVIGGNTLLDTSGIASGAFGEVTLDSGDASFFVPYYMFIWAAQVGSAATLAITGGALPVLLCDSRSGREPNMRRASDTDPSFGVNTTVYGQFKDLECNDWRRFASINNQQLTMRFYNPNEVAVHIFVDMWGIPAVNATG
jgi:hypothetical protein